MDARTKAAAIAAITFATIAMLAQNTSAQNGSAQESYQTEVTGGYTWLESDTNPDIELTEAVIEGTYNFQPVSLKGHPWNEAAFLEHSMQAMVRLSYFDFEVGSASSDGLLYGGGYRYAAKDSPVAADVRFQTGTLDGSGIDVDVTFLDASVGYWVKPNAIVGLAFALDELDPDGTFKIEETTVAAFGKIVHKLDDQRAVNAEARLGWTSVDTGTTDDDNFVLTLEGDYYFTPQYSAGAMLDVSVGDAESDEGTTLGVRGSAWFTPQVGVQVEYSRFWANDSQGADEDAVGLFLSVRF
jgi:hypothetical protein